MALYNYPSNVIHAQLKRVSLSRQQIDMLSRAGLDEAEFKSINPFFNSALIICRSTLVTYEQYCANAKSAHDSHIISIAEFISYISMITELRNLPMQISETKLPLTYHEYIAYGHGHSKKHDKVNASCKASVWMTNDMSSSLRLDKTPSAIIMSIVTELNKLKPINGRLVSDVDKDVVRLLDAVHVLSIKRERQSAIEHVTQLDRLYDSKHRYVWRERPCHSVK